jgi:predicted transcriptional regulator
MIQSTYVNNELVKFSTEHKLTDPNIVQLKACIIGYSQTGVWGIVYKIKQVMYFFVFFGRTDWKCSVIILFEKPAIYQETTRSVKDWTLAANKLAALIEANRKKTPLLTTTTEQPAAVGPHPSALKTSGATATAAAPVIKPAPKQATAAVNQPAAPVTDRDKDRKTPAPDKLKPQASSPATNSTEMPPTFEALAQRYKSATPAVQEQMKQQLLLEAKKLGLSETQAASVVENNIIAFSMTPEQLLETEAQMYNRATPARKAQMRQQMIAQVKKSGVSDAEASLAANDHIKMLERFDMTDEQMFEDEAREYNSAIPAEKARIKQGIISRVTPTGLSKNQATVAAEETIEAFELFHQGGMPAVIKKRGERYQALSPAEKQQAEEAALKMMMENGETEDSARQEFQKMLRTMGIPETAAAPPVDPLCDAID